MKDIDNRPLKSHVAEQYPTDHPAVPVVAALPDFMDRMEWDAALPILVRILRIRADPGGTP